MPVLLIVLLAFATAAATQPAPKVARIGMQCAPACKGSNHEAFLDELRKLGWVEGTNLVIERREAGSSLDEHRALAGDLVRAKPNLIVAFTPLPVRAVKAATSEIPIVMIFVAVPVGLGLASSLARPGGNLTGVATLAAGNLSGKALGILRELMPHAKRVAVLINPSNESHRLLFPIEAPAAATLGFQLDVIEVREAEEIPGAIATAKARGAEALWTWGDPILSSPANLVPDLAAKAGLPSSYLFRQNVQAGGLYSYGPDTLAQSRLGAHYVNRILKGAKPADLPIEQPTKFLLVINLKTAKSLGIEVPPSLLARAEEVIE